MGWRMSWRTLRSLEDKEEAVEEIGREQVIRELTEIVEAKGSDFVYKRPTGRSGCAYFFNGKPSCIVGHWMYRQGVHKIIPHANYLRFSRRLAREFGLILDRDAAEVLKVAQYWQDRGAAWGEALETAIEVSE